MKWRDRAVDAEFLHLYSLVVVAAVVGDDGDMLGNNRCFPQTADNVGGIAGDGDVVVVGGRFVAVALGASHREYDDASDDVNNGGDATESGPLKAAAK